MHLARKAPYSEAAIYLGFDCKIAHLFSLAEEPLVFLLLSFDFIILLLYDVLGSGGSVEVFLFFSIGHSNLSWLIKT